MTIGVYKMVARDVMTRGADTINDDESIQQAIELMVNLGLSALPVVDRDNHCVGVLTKTDIIQLAGQMEREAEMESGDLASLLFGVGLEEITSMKIKDVMTTHVLSAREDESVIDIADKMLKHEVHHVPICSAGNRVTGVVSSMDLVKAIREPITTT